MQVNESGGDRSVKLTGGRNQGPAKKLIFKLIRNKTIPHHRAFGAME